jgi:hypothetical protein
MKILKEHIEDLKVIQSGYPQNSREYEALRLAIVVLCQVYATNEHMMAIQRMHEVSSQIQTEKLMERMKNDRSHS